MTVRIGIASARLGTDQNIIVYESGKPGYLLEGLQPIVRKTDAYIATNVVAAAGTWTTKLDNSTGIFSPRGGVFGRAWKEAVVWASVGNSIVFIGTPDAVGVARGSAGLVTQVRWRDIVIDWFSQLIGGRPLEGVGVRAIRSALNLPTPRGLGSFVFLTQTRMTAALQEFGVSTNLLPNYYLNYPEASTSLRSWIGGVLSAGGAEIDWTSTTWTPGTGLAVGTDGRPTVNLQMRDGTQFTSSIISRFTDKHLEGFGGPTLDDGRRQVINEWSGSNQQFDTAVFPPELVTREYTAQSFEQDRLVWVRYPWDLLEWSRRTFGARVSRLNLSAMANSGDIRTLAANMIAKRCWPHERVTVSLRGSQAAGLTLGYGVMLDFALGTKRGTGFRMIGRVVGKTVDLFSEITKVEVEWRDRRDDDYSAFTGSIVDAPDP